jgi:hypothetical protein
VRKTGHKGTFGTLLNIVKAKIVVYATNLAFRIVKYF